MENNRTDDQQGQPTLYEYIGGAPTVRKLVDSFYAKVAVHPDLKPIFPDDLTETANKQYQFLTQFFGGPPYTVRTMDTRC